MIVLMSALALVVLTTAILSIRNYRRVTRAASLLEARAGSLHQSALAAERAVDRALSVLVNPIPEPTPVELELTEMLRHLNRAQTELERDFAPAQLVFPTWDRAQARRVVEQAHSHGALTDEDVEYVDTTSRLAREIAREAQAKRKLAAQF